MLIIAFEAHPDEERTSILPGPCPPEFSIGPNTAWSTTDDLEMANKIAKHHAGQGRPVYIAKVIGMWRPVAEPVEFVIIDKDDTEHSSASEKPKRGKKAEVAPVEPSVLGTPGVVSMEPLSAGLVDRVLSEMQTVAPRPDEPVAPAPSASMGDYDPFEAEQTNGKPAEGVVATTVKDEEPSEEFAVRRCRVGEDDLKCPRCSKGTIKALAGDELIRICPDMNCFPRQEPKARPEEKEPSTAPKAGPSATTAPEAIPETAAAGFFPGSTVGEMKAALAAAAQNGGGEGGPLGQVAAEAPAIPEESAVTTETRILGMVVPTPPAEWNDVPITNETTENIDSRGQLIALNAGLTEIGYGKELRHPAVMAILCDGTRLESLKDLTKAQAHLVLTWIDCVTPDRMAALATAIQGSRVKI